jgi:hypothetical protein
MDPAPDPAIFGLDLQAANKKLPVFFSKFFSLLLFGGIRTGIKEAKKHTHSHSTTLKEQQNYNQQDVYIQ